MKGGFGLQFLALALALPLTLTLGAAPPTTATAPADTRPAPAVTTQFASGDAVGALFTALAVRFDIMVVQSQTVNAFILKDCALPDKLQDALTLTQQMLEPQGYSLLQSFVDKRLILRIVPTKEAKKLELEESPVSHGTAGEHINVSNPDRLVTHLFPVTHAELLDTLRRTATREKDVAAEITGGEQIGITLILTGPALKVQQAVENLAKLDATTTGDEVVVRTLQLRFTDAQTTADVLNAGFERDSAPLKATVDQRTNSLILTGPEIRVLDIMITLIGQDARHGPLIPRPATPPNAVPATPAIPVLPELQPQAKPGAMMLPVRRLDEIAENGDNAGSSAGLVLFGAATHARYLPRNGYSCEILSNSAAGSPC